MNRKERVFVETVWAYYREHGRHDLPWRKTTNPYRILVSEVMLQQTQVERVKTKYREFLTAFPTTAALASAPLGDVLRVWQGLGYNRRAKLLWECAKKVLVTRRGRWPRRFDELRALPGIGPYTAGAVLAFAYNEGVPLIETNVRAVFLHHFFADRTEVPEREILALVERTLPLENPREWYAALMDYGAYLKKTHPNPSRRAKAHVRQSTFKGSVRQLRGAILRAVTTKPCTRRSLIKVLNDFDAAAIETQLAALTREGLLTKAGQRYQLPD
jgi:A/G-specific adenine glycosylase